MLITLSIYSCLQYLSFLLQGLYNSHQLVILCLYLPYLLDLLLVLHICLFLQPIQANFCHFVILKYRFIVIFFYLDGLKKNILITFESIVFQAKSL